MFLLDMSMSGSNSIEHNPCASSSIKIRSKDGPASQIGW